MPCAHVDIDDPMAESRTTAFQEPRAIFFECCSDLSALWRNFFEIVRLRVAVLYGSSCHSVGHLDLVGKDADMPISAGGLQVVDTRAECGELV